MSLDSAVQPDVEQTAARYTAVRKFSERLCETLSPEDCAIQSMPDVSPTRWHLAHTTWFFETFLLLPAAGYRPFNEEYQYLFNSYYNSLGEQFPRSRRGLLSRPGLEEVVAWRRHVDRHLLDLLHTAEGETEQARRVLEVGLHHEQQHQELMLTDIKHVLSCNPLRPTYRAGTFASHTRPAAQRMQFQGGLHSIGHQGDGFAFDNESPRHQVFVDDFSLCSQLVTCGEYLQFVEAGGYQSPEFWLSLGWQTVCEQNWSAPLYWFRRNDRWHQFTLAGPRALELQWPVAHVSYFEADAYARWCGARLPTEAEWEVAADSPLGGCCHTGNFVNKLLAEPTGARPRVNPAKPTGARLEENPAIHPGSAKNGGEGIEDLFGDVWEWTASPYTAYPGYKPPTGALGEYNGKFMCNQYVLRGGSCATSSDHMRATYRNFFPPDARWQFSGIRLAW